jgi:hypothetical protein
MYTTAALFGLLTFFAVRQKAVEAQIDFNNRMPPFLTAIVQCFVANPADYKLGEWGGISTWIVLIACSLLFL